MKLKTDLESDEEVSGIELVPRDQVEEPPVAYRIVVRPKFEEILDDAASIAHVEISKLGQKAKLQKHMSSKDITDFVKLADALTKLSREDRFRNVSSEEDIERLSDEELRELTKEVLDD